MTYSAWLSTFQPQFPCLTGTNSRPTSPADEDYNCIAWAANDSSRWWWPDPQNQFYWPPAVPRIEALDAFVTAFSDLGFTQQTDASIEAGKEKIAIFVNRGKPTHAARQLPDGWWASKLGQQIDIEHELSAVEGPVYGAVAAILARVAVEPADSYSQPV